MVLSRIIQRVIVAAKPAWTTVHERAFNIDTAPEKARFAKAPRFAWRGEIQAGALHEDNFHYATVDYLNLRRVFRVLKPGAEDVFYDIGSGKGRILCFTARRTLKRCVGVELSESLCEIARANAARARGIKTPIHVICGDAATADLSGGTIYFMFNPFGPQTLRDTLQNIKTSIETHPRRLRILYYNSEYEDVLRAEGWLRQLSRFRSLGGLPITLWEHHSW